MLPRTPEPELMDTGERAEAYRTADLAGPNQRFVEHLLTLADDAFGANAPLRVVDLGCGPADIPIRLAIARPHWTITAVDGARAMLREAEQDIARRLSPDQARRIDLVHADALATSLPDAAFDIVTHNSLLHHVRDAAALWSECRRLARPGGLIFMRDLFRPASNDAVERLVAEHAADAEAIFVQEFRQSLHAAYTADEIRDQLGAAGLAGLRVETVSDRHVDAVGLA